MDTDKFLRFSEAWVAASCEARKRAWDALHPPRHIPRPVFSTKEEQHLIFSGAWVRATEDDRDAALVELTKVRGING